MTRYRLDFWTAVGRLSTLRLLRRRAVRCWW